MDIKKVHKECLDALEAKELNAVQKLKVVNDIIQPLFETKGPIAWREGDAIADGTNVYGDPETTKMLSDLANKFRTIVRESAWQQETPITLKDALGRNDTNVDNMFDQDTWDMMESWLDHDRDYKWNYLNLVSFNLKYNKTSDGKSFWLSPQHFRMTAIIDTVARLIDGEEAIGFDLDLAKALYKKEDQIPQAIQFSVKSLRHIA
tara:strand:- start:344 stop:958 length:615 start_codon:yes stop_codon:yes gene_type:complete